MDWTEFKLLLATKRGVIQSEDQGLQYLSWFDDGNNRYDCYIEKTEPKSIEQIDFETNFLPITNAASVKKTVDEVPYVRVTAKTVGLIMRIHGGDMVAAPNATTTSQMSFTAPIEIVGCILGCKNPNHGDTINVQVVDVDNILGYGAGVVLSQFAIDVPGELCEIPINVESTTADLIIQGLYMVVEYINVGPNEANVHYAYKYYR